MSIAARPSVRLQGDDGSCVIADSAQYLDRSRQDDRPFDLGEARTRAQDPRGFVWMVLGDPSVEEMDEARRFFELPPLAVEDAHGGQRPKLEQYGDDLFWVLDVGERS